MSQEIATSQCTLLRLSGGRRWCLWSFGYAPQLATHRNSLPEEEDDLYIGKLLICDAALQMGGPEGVLESERYALVTGPEGGMHMHAIPRQPHQKPMQH